MSRSVVSIETYCRNTTSGNAIVVSVGELDIFFSYRTPVAFALPGVGRVVRKNEWGQTTGKHLNAIDNGRKADRVSGEDFEAKLADALGR